MSDTATATTFLDSLRKATQQSHTALEALPLSASLLKPDVTNAGYTNYLTLMRDVVKDAEENIFPALSRYIPENEIRNKTHFIEADLETLGSTMSGYTKVFTAGNPHFSPAFALGILYVIEGSSLGGRVILKNITAVLGHNSEKGATYFTGYGNQTGSHWKSFLAALIQFEQENNAGEEIIAGANFAFEAIHTHFSTSAN
ncbi:biliverdin-producing heme oxygenase [Flavobacterium sp. RHBU_24]|uniref:biliverdin-producing heme oxygenase n=1 Tax=Flavobacterium sp. RHBU_24 TaxID=3391185 RepID=UPI003984B366